MATRDLGASAAKRRREGRLRSWLRHERQTNAMELAAALHHSRDGRLESYVGSQRGTCRVLRTFLGRWQARGDAAATSRGGATAAVGDGACGKPRTTGPSLGLAVLGGGREGVDSSALVFLVSRAVDDRKKDEDEKLKEEARMDLIEDRILEGAPVSTADVKAWQRWAMAAPSSAGTKRKGKKRRKKKLPKASSSRSSLRHSLATCLGKKFTGACLNGDLWWLPPDEKTRVMMEYEHRADVSVEFRNTHTIVSSIQLAEPPQTVCSKESAGYSGLGETALSMDEMNKLIDEKVLRKTLAEIILQIGQPALSSEYVHLYFQASGKFSIGDPPGDADLTGRKIIIDTYSGCGSHGGGAFSGKDPTKKDRIAASICRQMAKSVVKSGLSCL